MLLKRNDNGELETAEKGACRAASMLCLSLMEMRLFIDCFGFKFCSFMQSFCLAFALLLHSLMKHAVAVVAHLQQRIRHVDCRDEF